MLPLYNDPRAAHFANLATVALPSIFIYVVNDTGQLRKNWRLSCARQQTHFFPL